MTLGSFAGWQGTYAPAQLSVRGQSCKQGMNALKIAGGSLREEGVKMSWNVPGWIPGEPRSRMTHCRVHAAATVPVPTSTPDSAQSGVAGGGAADAVVTPRWIRLFPRRPGPVRCITVRPWHLSQPSGIQPPNGRRMNSRRTSIHQAKVGSAASSVKPPMLQLIPQTRRSKY